MSPDFNLTALRPRCHPARFVMSNALRFAVIAVVISILSPLSTYGETWFQEAKRIRLEADAIEPRSKSFEILPDFEFTEHSIKAGAIFKNKGQRVIAKHTWVHVELPVGATADKPVYKFRERVVNYNGEPTGTGRSRDTWAAGFFSYTVTATYKGNEYVRSFKVGKAGLISSNPPK